MYVHLLTRTIIGCRVAPLRSRGGTTSAFQTDPTDECVIHIYAKQCGAFGNVREVYFYPTRIAASVVFPGADPRAGGHVVNDLQDMRIIVETNHQVAV